MAIDDPDYQQFPYVFDNVKEYAGDMTESIRRAARDSIREYVGQPINLLEIGVWEGRSACWMLDNVLTHPDARYYGIDPWVSPPAIPPIARRHLAYHGSKATLIEADSKVVVPRVGISFPVIVVDGDHSYEGCYADLVNCWEKLQVGGVMICDDYCYPGLPGVPKAVDQFMSEHPAQLVVLHKEEALAFKRTS